MKASACLLALLVLPALPAQNVLHGNGIPSAYIGNTPGVLGGNLTVDFGSPTTPNGLAVISISTGFGPVVIPHPLVGLIAIDPLAPGYQIFFFGLNSNGDGSVTVPLPPGFATPTTPPLFANTLTFEGAQWSFSKTVRIDWANPDGWEAVAPLAVARQLHTATALGTGKRDNVTEVLICGGATGSIIIPTPMASAELYSPLLRQATPLPSMSLPRASHQAVRLNSGLVLITGGVTTGGVVTATCELFDPNTGQFLPVPSMNAPRAGHAMTLLDDGRVLVSGGVADWQNAAIAFIAALNTAQDTAEVFDPGSFVWTLLPTMASKRFGHSQTKLLDGRVLIAAGINGGSTGTNPFGTGGQIPTYTPSCEVFDPATNTFAPTAPINSPFFSLARGFHGASLLADGRVYVTGGFVASGQNGEAVATSSALVWNGTSWLLTPGPASPLAMHTQVPLGNGALMVGGFTGDLTQLQTLAQTTVFDGANVTPLADLGIDHGSGTTQPRATHTCTPLYDGTFLIYGGGLWPATLGDGLVYTPN